MPGLRSTLTLLVIAVGMGAYIYFIERHRAPSSEPEPNEQLFTFEVGDLSELHVTDKDGGMTELERVDDTWQIVAPIETAADDTTASSLASTLESLEVRRVVEESPITLEPFGLHNSTLSVGFSLNESDALQHLLIGDETPTGADRYAKLADNDRVFLIAGYLNSTLNKTTFDLRDKTILEFERDDLDALEIITADQTVRFAKAGDDWALAEPLAVPADFSTVQGLISSLNTGRMQSVEREEANELQPYGLIEPVYTVAAHAGSATATLHVGDEAPDGSRYARDASRALVFTIDASLVTSLERKPSEYRRKELFRFRPFNANRLEIEWAGDTFVFKKTEAQTEENQDGWQQLEPDLGDVELAEMDDLLAKLSNLRAESFLISRSDAGLGPQNVAATVRVLFGDEEEERVVIWKSGEDIFAVHGAEPGAAQIDTPAFNDAIAALETIQTED